LLLRFKNEIINTYVERPSDKVCVSVLASKEPAVREMEVSLWWVPRQRFIAVSSPGVNGKVNIDSFFIMCFVSDMSIVGVAREMHKVVSLIAKRWGNQKNKSLTGRVTDDQHIQHTASLDYQTFCILPYNISWKLYTGDVFFGSKCVDDTLYLLDKNLKPPAPAEEYHMVSFSDPYVILEVGKQMILVIASLTDRISFKMLESYSTVPSTDMIAVRLFPLAEGKSVGFQDRFFFCDSNGLVHSHVHLPADTSICDSTRMVYVDRNLTSSFTSIQLAPISPIDVSQSVKIKGVVLKSNVDIAVYSVIDELRRVGYCEANISCDVWCGLVRRYDFLSEVVFIDVEAQVVISLGVCVPLGNLDAHKIYQLLNADLPAETVLLSTVHRLYHRFMVSQHISSRLAFMWDGEAMRTPAEWVRLCVQPAVYNRYVGELLKLKVVLHQAPIALAALRSDLGLLGNVNEDLMSLIISDLFGGGCHSVVVQLFHCFFIFVCGPSGILGMIMRSGRSRAVRLIKPGECVCVGDYWLVATQGGAVVSPSPIGIDLKMSWDVPGVDLVPINLEGLQYVEGLEKFGYVYSPDSVNLSLSNGFRVMVVTSITDSVQYWKDGPVTNLLLSLRAFYALLEHYICLPTAEILLAAIKYYYVADLPFNSACVIASF